MYTIYWEITLNEIFEWEKFTIKIKSYLASKLAYSKSSLKENQENKLRFVWAKLLPNTWVPLVCIIF